jgi:hypothetical protein
MLGGIMSNSRKRQYLLKCYTKLGEANDQLRALQATFALGEESQEVEESYQELCDLMDRIYAIDLTLRNEETS